MPELQRNRLPKNPLVRLLFIKITQGFLPGIPLWTQKSVFGLAAFLAKATGVERRLEKYQAD